MQTFNAFAKATEVLGAIEGMLSFKVVAMSLKGISVEVMTKDQDEMCSLSRALSFGIMRNRGADAARRNVGNSFQFT